MKRPIGIPGLIPSETVFLAEDWILYVGIPGHFGRSEMLGPCLILSPPDSPFHLVPDNADAVVAEAIRHPGGLWSTGSGTGVAVAYLDPISDNARTVQRQCQGAPSCVPLRRPSHQLNTFKDLIEATVQPVAALEFVASWRSALDQLPSVDSTPSAQLQLVAREVAKRAEGRLNLTLLSAIAGLSTDHLRQRFKQVVGMTLSRYQMWHRFHAAIGYACQEFNSRGRVSADSALLGTGFYDLPHGSRSMRRYFGMTAVSTSGRTMRFVDCRRPS